VGDRDRARRRGARWRRQGEHGDEPGNHSHFHARILARPALDAIRAFPQKRCE
jgi:hypothetical protein